MNAAPWHRPRERYVGSGVYIADVYLDHYLAAFVYALWLRLRRCFTEAAHRPLTPEVFRKPSGIAPESRSGVVCRPTEGET